MPNPRANDTLLSEHDLDGQALGLEFHWVFEQVTSSTEGTTTTRLVGDAVESVLFVVCCSASDAGWDWDDVSTLAQVQASKIRAVATNI